MKRRNVETSKRRNGIVALRCGEQRIAQRGPSFDFSTIRLSDVSRTRRGFTLLEVVIVIAILAILAALAIPRLLDHEHRLFNLTCDRTSDLLTIFAQRSALGQTPVGIRFDYERRWLEVMVYDVPEGSLDGQGQWRTDPFITPVKFPPMETARLLEVRGDGREFDTSVWPLSTTPGQDRPSIEIILEGPSRTVTIALPPYAVSPKQIDWDDPQAELYTPIDLTSIGRSREEW